MKEEIDGPLHYVLPGQQPLLRATNPQNFVDPSPQAFLLLIVRSLSFI
ncbi:MAG TPA: hypothetical protein VNX26_00445 [Candidatus Acidoferrum sp.]|nr:hypothetical protein [Candidatus Acidoferrum sp.]